MSQIISNWLACPDAGDWYPKLQMWPVAAEEAQRLGVFASQSGGPEFGSQYLSQSLYACLQLQLGMGWAETKDYGDLLASSLTGKSCLGS